MAVWSTINRSSFIESNGRFDADYFKPEYLKITEIVKKSPYIEFGKTMQILTDYHANGSYELLRNNVTILDQPNFAYMVRTTDIENDNFDTDVKYVDEHAYYFLSKSKVYGNEIIMNKIGSAGKVYLMPVLNRPVTLGMNQFMIRTNSKFKSNSIYAFLISKYGEKLIEQQVSGAVPLSITKNGVKSIIMPVYDDEIQNSIDELISLYQVKRNESKLLYTQATKLLEHALGLDKIQFEKPKSYTAQFSEVVSFNRNDADYFQTKYRQIENHIENYATRSLISLCSFIKGIEVGSKEYTESGKLFIRVSNINNKGFHYSNSDKFISESIFNSLQYFKPSIGEILLTKDGTVGLCYVVDEEIEGIISGGIVKLIQKDISIPKEYLALAINSQFCQMQIHRECSGALILHWKPEQIRKLKIPILKNEQMRELSDLVTQSKTALKISKELLEQAKLQVEQIIENKRN